MRGDEGQAAEVQVVGRIALRVKKQAAQASFVPVGVDVLAHAAAAQVAIFIKADPAHRVDQRADQGQLDNVRGGIRQRVGQHRARPARVSRVQRDEGRERLQRHLHRQIRIVEFNRGEGIFAAHPGARQARQTGARHGVVAVRQVVRRRPARFQNARERRPIAGPDAQGEERIGQLPALVRAVKQLPVAQLTARAE